MLKVHLGCGANIMPGWQNLDCVHNKPGVTYWRCPQVSLSHLFGANSIDFIYTEHFVEHITLGEFELLLADAYRTLKPGGVMRISTPDLKVICRGYINEAIQDYSQVGWFFESGADYVNEAMRLWGHQYLYDYDKLMSCVKKAGFKNHESSAFRKSRYPELCGLECRPDYRDLIVEIKK